MDGLHDTDLSTEDVVWLIGYLADNAPPDLLMPPRFTPGLALCRKAYNPSRFTVAMPLSRTAPDR